jgi:hypothetical protein
VTSPLNPRALGKAIAEERRSKGLKQKEVVELVSSFYSDERSYRRVELGERLPDRDAVIAILVSGLAITEAEKVNRILALGGYAPLTAAEAPQLGTAVFQPISPALPAPPSASFWNRTNENSGVRSASLIAVCSLAVGCLIAGASQETALVTVSAILYGCLYAVSILLESAFDPAPAPNWPVASAVFGLTLVTSVFALAIDAWLARAGVSAALPLSLAIFLIAAAAQWVIARSALSESVVVPTTRFHAHTAQAAHLKNTIHFLVIVVLFWLPPFHCVAVLRREIQSGHAAWARAILPHHLLLGRDFACISAEWLWFGFLFLLLLAIPMAVRLLENLKSGPRLNTYTALLYLRGVLYFLLIFICLIWYSAAIASLSV